MKQQIKRWDTGAVIFEGEYDTREAAILGAVAGGVDLYRASLDGASLDGASLNRASLDGASLDGASLDGASLVGARLDGASGIRRELCCPLDLLRDQPGKIRAYKLVNADGEGPVKGGIKYEIGKRVEVADADTTDEHCAEGINVATLDWCLKEWRSGYKILLVEFEAKDIASIPLGTDGKFRLFRCDVVGEKVLDYDAIFPKAEAK